MKKKDPASDLRSLGESYIDRTSTDFPQWGSGVGFRQYEPLLAGSDAATRLGRIRFLEGLLAETESISPSQLKGDDWLDRRAFLSLLRTELFTLRDRERWRNNPQECCDGAVGAVFELLIRHAGDLRSAVPAIESRLEAIPRFLKDGAAAIRRPVPLWTRLAIRSCHGASGFMLTVGRTIEPLSSRPARAREFAVKAAAAFDDYARTIRSRRPGRPGDFAVGREDFEFLVREKTGLDWSLPEIEAEGWRLIRSLRSEMEEEAGRVSKGSRRQPGAFGLIRAARDSWMPEAPLLELYSRSSAAWRQRVEESGLYPMPPGETLTVTPVPDFMRDHFPTAAYSAPGPFEGRQRGIFWVNDLGLTKKNRDEALCEERQHFGLELTSAHEGYPGHHLQFAVQNLHPSRIRRLCSHAIFYEGWTMWCEKLAVGKGWVKGPHASIARLQQLHDALWRAHRIVIDCGLHSGKLTHAAAAAMLVEGVGFTPSRARADVNWYTAQPTVPMSYLLGRLELERVKEKKLAGGWTLRRFHDWALGHGAVPWRWIEQAEGAESGRA